MFLDWTILIVIAMSAIPIRYLIIWSRHFAEPSIGFSEIQYFANCQSWRVSWCSLPKKLFWFAGGLFCCAIINPHFYKDQQSVNTQKLPIEGIAIYLVQDQSGSMNEAIVVDTPFGGLERISKIDLVKKLSSQFISGDSSIGLVGRPNDMIGLIYFARGAHIISPLTLDHDSLLKELNHFKAIGTKDEDGTSIGYALYKTASMIVATKHYAQELLANGESPYTIKNSVIILITDGLQDPNPLDKGKRLRNIDVPEAADYIKDQGIRLYIINVDPGMSTKEFAPYQNIMQRAAALTGGKFFMVNSENSLQNIYKEIDGLEKSEIVQSSINKEERPDLYQRVSLYPYLIAFGLLILLIAVILETLVFRRVP